jgi:CRP-like cAMP-binding protein
MAKVNNNLISLPRGGYIIDTDEGYIQFGSPPETIKDSMFLKKGVPQVFILPVEFFNWIKGISVAEVEFPIYYNFFIKNRKTLIICEESQVKKFNDVLTEAIFGPKNLNLDDDFNPNYHGMNTIDLKNEINYFRKNLEIFDLVEFGFFQNNQYDYKGIIITHEENGNFTVTQKDKSIITIPGKIEYIPKYDIAGKLQSPHYPPLFGITCLGSSHGFDPEENTSGFILWINHKGIMIDPPVNSTEWLKDSNVNPKFIDSIILTHCHADHDAGTFQKILEEGKVTVYTTKTIMDSFLKKYAALTNVSTEYLSKLFTFKPVKIKSSVIIHGAGFNFFYTLHSIPTIGFKMEFQGKSFTYSSDHNNDPNLHKSLFESGLISKARYEELTNFCWDADIIYHESGYAPLHTPISILQALPDDIKKKTIVYHISKKDFPKDPILKLAKFGIEYSTYLNVKSPDFEKTYEILGLLNYLDFFEDMPTSKAMEFINIVNEKKFKKNETIIKKGEIGDKFYIISYGNIKVVDSNLETKKIYGACDYFGERALVTGEKRAADIKAETDVVVYTIDKDKFLYFISGTEFEKTLLKLSKTRDNESWNVLSTSKIFGILTSTQKTILESMMQKIERNEIGIIIKEGELINSIYIIRDGKVLVTKNDKEISILQRGDFIGSMVKVHQNNPISYTFSNQNPVSLYEIKKEDILKFLDKNPGLIMKLTQDF